MSYSRRETYRVTLERPQGVTVEEMKDFIRNAVASEGGSLPVQDPLFGDAVHLVTVLKEGAYPEVRTDSAHPYTVLLLRPEVLAGDDFGRDNYQSHVYAQGVRDAIQKAREEVAGVDGMGTGASYDVLAVYSGILEDLS